MSDTEAAGKKDELRLQYRCDECLGYFSLKSDGKMFKHKNHQLGYACPGEPVLNDYRTVSIAHSLKNTESRAESAARIASEQIAMLRSSSTPQRGKPGDGITQSAHVLISEGARSMGAPHPYAGREGEIATPGKKMSVVEIFNHSTRRPVRIHVLNRNLITLKRKVYRHVRG